MQCYSSSRVLTLTTKYKQFSRLFQIHALAGVLLLLPSIAFTQTRTFRVVKDRPFIFYYTGNGDTLATNKSKFVLLLPNNKITPLVIEIQNGYIQPLRNDTLYEFTYVPGYNYSCGFKCEVFTTDRQCEWVNGVNGVHEDEKKKITIRIYEQGEKIIENVFWMR